MNPDVVERHARLDSPLHRVDARAKIAAFLALTVISVSTPPSAFLAFAGYGAILAVASVASRLPWIYLLRRSLVILPFVAMVGVSLPFFDGPHASGGYTLGVGGPRIPYSGLLVFWNVAVKSVIGVLSVALLTGTTPLADLLHGAERMGLPRAFTMTVGFAYRYVFVLADEALRMKHARDARGYGGRWLWRAGVVGQIIGTLFLRTWARAERIHLAMLARGFEGRLPARTSAPMCAKDYGFVAAMACLAVAVRWGLA